MLVKFIKFCTVGGIGAIITFSLTWLFTEKAGLWYMMSLAIATIIAMTSNFTLNNYWTFGVRQRTPDDADYDWHSFYHGNPAQKWWKQQIANTIWEWIPDESKLLNIGCGSSPIARKYEHGVNVDLSQEKLEFLKKNISPVGIFVIGDAHSLDFPNNTFDHVLCIELIEHCIFPERVISEIHRVLKVGGNTIIATPDYAKRRWHIAEMFTPYKDTHGAKLTKCAVESMCRAIGLEARRCKYIAGCDLVEEFVKIS